MCVNVSTSCEGTLPLSSLLDIHLQKGSIICISLGVSFQSPVRCGGPFTLSVVDAVVGSVGGVVSVWLPVLLQVWVVGPSWVDVTRMLIEAVGFVGLSLTSTNSERQSAALLWAPDIHQNVMLYMVSSKDYMFTLLLAFLPFRNICKGLWSLWTIMSDLCI